MTNFILSHLTICISNAIFAIVLLLLLWLPHKKIFSKLNNKKILKKFIQVLYLVGILLIVIVGVYDINYLYSHMKVQNSPQLTGVTATVLTVMATVFGYFYNKKQDKIQAIHAESNWRSRLLDLEKKPYYTKNDLLELNSFINPFHKKNDDLDYLINFAIKTILTEDEKKKDVFLPFYKLVSKAKIPSYLKEILQRNNPQSQNAFSYEPKNENEKTKFKALDESNKDNVITCILTPIKNEPPLSPEANIIVRKCIHALLKNDWMNANA